MKISVCDLCYEFDEIKPTVARYEDLERNVYDVCENCLEKVKKLELKWWKIK